MPATVANFEDTQGDTLRITFPVNDADGNPYDFTGSTVRGQVREANPDDDSPLVADFTVEATALGEATLVLPAATTAGMVGKFAYDVEIQSPAGDLDTVFAGTLTFAQQVTWT